MTVDERLEGLSSEEILRKLSLEEHLQGLASEEIAVYLQKLK